MKYTEHEKLHKVKEQSQWLGSFLDWLNEQGVGLSSYQKIGGRDDNFERLTPINKSINKWLSEFYDIDLVKLEEEKQHIIKNL